MQILYAVLSPLFTMHECCANLAPTAEQLPNDLLFTLSGTMRILAGDSSYDTSSCFAAVFRSSISQQYFTVEFHSSYSTAVIPQCLNAGTSGQDT
ncbi:MAG: hypothetical protein RL156_499 [Bacteroidota bacterium]